MWILFEQLLEKILQHLVTLNLKATHTTTTYVHCTKGERGWLEPRPNYRALDLKNCESNLRSVYHLWIICSKRYKRTIKKTSIMCDHEVVGLCPGQWLRHSGISSCFGYQTSIVPIRPSALFFRKLIYSKLYLKYWRDKNKWRHRTGALIWFGKNSHVTYFNQSPLLTTIKILTLPPGTANFLKKAGVRITNYESKTKWFETVQWIGTNA